MRKLYLFLLSVIVAGTLFQSKAVDLYIRGAQFGWEAKDCTDANKFTTTDDNVYKITLATLKSGFKIATLTSSGGWNDSYNFGSASNIEPGKEYTLTTAGNSGSITTKGASDLTNVTLTFTLSTKKLKVEGQAEEAKYPEALYMVGDFNGWTTNDANYKMTREGETGKYVIENVNIPTGKKIKFCDGSWDNNWGAVTDGDPLPVGTEFVPNYNANNYKLTEALSNATIEFYYNIENIESAKAKVTNGGVTPPEPTFPENLYVVGQVDGATKWAANHGVLLVKDGSVYTIESIKVEDAGEGSGYFGLATQLGATADSWNGATGLNGGDRYGAQTKDAPLAPGTPATIVKFAADVNASAAYSWKVAAGTYSLTADLDAMTISIVKKDDPTPPEPEYPELYIRGSFTNYEAKPEYKMTREGKVYTLSGIEIPADAKFKISDDTDNWAINFGGTGVEGVEGEQTDELANGTEKNAWFNSSVNFTVAKKLTNATVTFTFEGAKDGVANKIKVEGTEVVTPPEPEYPELYVRGTMTDYNVMPEYKMTREGKVYTLSGIEIPAGAKFKISDNTDNWAINFGGTGVEGVEDEQTDELANGTEKNAWFNSSVNFTVAKKLTNATVTFTFEGAKPGVANKIKVEGTEVDDPQPENPDLYIIGLNNDWNNFPASNKFTHAEGTTVYTLELASMAAGTNFKFCPENWGGEGEHLYVFGAENADNGKITEAKLNTSINMKRSDTGSANFVTDPKLKDVKITLDINYTTQVYTMKLEGTVDTEPVTIPEHPEFYLVGTFAQSTTGGWDTMDDWKFTCDEATNTYTIEGKTFEADAQFKIAPKNWEYPEIVFGAATAEQAVTFNEAINLTKGNDASKNFKFTEKAENVKLVFKYVADGTSTLTVTKTSGIDGIESGIDGVAEYYNMQGVRVMNPEEGIYIVRRGNKVTKEIVRK